jgi:hypothetical protein
MSVRKRLPWDLYHYIMVAGAKQNTDGKKIKIKKRERL